MRGQVYTGFGKMLRQETRLIVTLHEKGTLQSNRDGREEGSRKWTMEKQGVEKQGTECQTRQKTEMQEVPHKWWVQPDQILDFVHPVEEFGYVHNH